MTNYQICTRCIMDTTDPDIHFSENGECNHCTVALESLKNYPFNLSPAQKKMELDKIVSIIKSDGIGRQYDCIIGLSGGVDSSYLALLVKRLLGLKPLAVHLDNGWNSEISMSNIENICRGLDIDLYTHVIDWEEFKDLQLSFLRASTPDSEVPSDHAIVTILYEVAAKYGIRNIIGGTNFETESILPGAWSAGHTDWKYIRSVQKMFGTKRLVTFPHRSFVRHLKFKLFDRTKWHSLLNFLPYNKDDAKLLISEQLGWKDYGRKHGESNYTRIYQEYILPTKFGYDKRRAHYSSLIVAGRLSREEALSEVTKPTYPDLSKRDEDIRFLCAKFAITETEFDAIMKLAKKTMDDYPSYEKSVLVKAAWKLIRRVQSQ